jgi:hypothetical protein
VNQPSIVDVSLKIPQVVVSIDNRNVGLQIVIYFCHVAYRSRGLPIAALASEAFAGPRKKRAMATATSTPINDPKA